MIPGIGTIVNSAVVAAGGTIGMLIKKGMPQRFQQNLFTGLGITVVVIGISGALAGMFRVSENGMIDRENMLMLVLSMAIGGVAGELIRVDRLFEKLSEWLKKRFRRDGDNRFNQGFVSAAMLFCVGAMAIVGAMEDGLMGNPETLFAKSVLDGTMAVVLGSVYGIGVAVSAVAILVYQGAVTLFSFALRAVITDVVVLQMSMVGSVVIILVGVNMMGLKKVNAANFLPATFMPLIWAIICTLRAILA